MQPRSEKGIRIAIDVSVKNVFFVEQETEKGVQVTKKVRISIRKQNYTRKIARPGNHEHGLGVLPQIATE